MSQPKQPRNPELAGKKQQGRAQQSPNERVDDAGPAREEPEDEREAARQTTPAGKGRSQ
jgi:hypothetical protein